MINWRLSSMCLAAGFVFLAGCGSDGPFEYVPVHGKIAFDDGTAIPAGGMVLQFKAIDAQPVGEMTPRIAQAQVDGNGTFTAATSYRYGDGLIPGKHKVAIQFATDAKGNLLIPDDYVSLATTPLVVETGDGNIDIKVPRP
jgi:predicted small lipoprotein YifL